MTGAVSPVAALRWEDVVEACRVIYKAAGESFMLPPLIRDASAGAARPGYTYYSLTDDRCVRLVVEFDQDYVDANRPPYARLPLLFRCELCDLDFRETPVPLDEATRFELIRAFLLGAKAPIFADPSPGGAGYKLSLQLSSTFFVECGELIDEGGHPTPTAISRTVASALYERSADLFKSREDGVAVWSLRARETLFGETPPPPESLWPDAASADVAANESAGAIVVLGAAAVPATSPLPPGGPLLAAPPIYAAETGGALTLARPPGPLARPSARLMRMAAAVFAVAGAASAFGILALRGDDPAPNELVAGLEAQREWKPAPPVAVTRPAEPVSAPAARTAAPAALFDVTGAAARDEPQQLASAPDAPPPGPSSTAALVVREPQAYPAIPGLGARDLPRGSCAAQKSEPAAAHATPPAHGARSARARRGPPNPLVFMERTFAGVVKEVRRLPQRVSSLFSGSGRRR
jgi:hypothetical protein